MLSVVLATFNEEENIGRCLKSVGKIADEIVVVDGSSKDNTRKIAKKMGARVLKTDNPKMFHINKQKALELAKHEWILQLDADEEVSDDLAIELIEVIGMSNEERDKREIENKVKRRLFEQHQKILERRDGEIGDKSGDLNAYFVPRRNYFLGKFLKYGGMYPDGVIRLVRKGKARFPCKDVHEQIAVEGRVGWLSNDLNHYDSPTFEKYLKRADRYTSLTAQRMKKEKIAINVVGKINYLVVKPVGVFLCLYMRHKGILDGVPGLVWAIMSGLHYPLAFLKYWESERGSGE